MHDPVKNVRLEAVLNTMIDGVIMIDYQGLIAKFNPACERIFGYDAQDVIGLNISALMPSPYQRDHDDYIRNYQSSGVAKIIGIGREVSGLRKDGSIFPMHLSVGEMRDGEVIAYVGVIRDLTAEQKARQDFEALQQQHFHLSRVSAMDQMGAAIAHELNQPLTAIMNYMDAGVTMAEGEKALDRERLGLVMAKSSEQAARAAGILSRLRRFIETGDVEKQLAAPEALLKSSTDLVLPMFKNEGIETRYDVSSALPDILVSDVQVQQVLVNLIKNACEAMLGEASRVLTLGARAQDDQLIFSVSDTGMGLSAADFDTLFQPFSSDKSGGLGVGLSISRTIIGNHGGALWAEHNSPKGCRFYVSLPIG